MSLQTKTKLSTFPFPMQQIGDVVLNGKKDIKFHRGAENRVGAAKFARQHNLVLGPPDEDINGDKIPDVVLYDKNGNPVLINGYGATPSKSPYRNKLATKYQTIVNLIGEIAIYFGRNSSHNL